MELHDPNKDAGVLFSALEPVSKIQHAELQNGWSWKGSLEIIWSTSPATAGSPQQVQQDLIRVCFEYPQRRRLYNLSGQCAPVLCHLDSKVFPHSLMEFPVIQLNLSLLFLPLGITEKSLAPSS